MVSTNPREKNLGREGKEEKKRNVGYRSRTRTSVRELSLKQVNIVVPLHMNVFPRISTSHFIVRLEEDFWNVRFQWLWYYLKKKNGITEKAKKKKMVLPSDNSCCFSNSDLTPEDYKQRMKIGRKKNTTAKLSMFCSQKKHSSYCCSTKKFCQKQKKKYFISAIYYWLFFKKKEQKSKLVEEGKTWLSICFEKFETLTLFPVRKFLR